MTLEHPDLPTDSRIPTNSPHWEDRQVRGIRDHLVVLDPLHRRALLQASGHCLQALLHQPVLQGQVLRQPTVGREDQVEAMVLKTADLKKRNSRRSVSKRGLRRRP